jgi:glycosyltransferase involved in cell wall biosynthesis
LGPVEDLAPLYRQARLFIAPARYAGGIAAKVVEAACHGLPVVASAILARQLGWAAGTEIMPARDAAAFAAAVTRLDRDDVLWRRLRQGMLARAAAQFDPDDFAAEVRAAVAF